MIIKEEIGVKCKRASTCPHCGSKNGTVRKVGTGLKLVHEPLKTGLTEEHLLLFNNAKENNSEIEPHISKAMEDLDPAKVLRLFERIPAEDRELLDTPFPERFIMTNHLVPPLCIRPSVMMPGVGGSNEDDLTVKIADIISVNNICREAMQEGKTISQIMGVRWDGLVHSVIANALAIGLGVFTVQHCCLSQQ